MFDAYKIILYSNGTNFMSAYCRLADCWWHETCDRFELWNETEDCYLSIDNAYRNSFDWSIYKSKIFYELIL